MPRARRCHFPRGVVLLLWSVRHLSQLCRCRLLGGPECLLCRRRQSGRLGRAHTLHQWTDPVPASAPTFGAAPRVRPYFVQRANFAVRSCQDARLRPSFRSAQDYAVYPSETLTLQSPLLQADECILSGLADPLQHGGTEEFPPRPPLPPSLQFPLPSKPDGAKARVTLPLDFVALLEFSMLANKFPQLQLAIGALLVMIWGSLRFSDALHVRWGTLLYEQAVG